jgi:predicted sulfurtransferase
MQNSGGLRRESASSWMKAWGTDEIIKPEA